MINDDLFFWNQAFFDLDDEPIGQSIAFLPFFIIHKYYRNYLDKIFSEDFIDIFLDHINLRLFAVFIDDDEIHFQVYIEFFSEIILVDHHLVGRKKGDQIVF